MTKEQIQSYFSSIRHTKSRYIVT